MLEENIVGYKPTDTIDDYYDCDKVDLALEGFPDYILTKDGRVWSSKTYNQRPPNWLTPVRQDYPSEFILQHPTRGRVCINVDILVSKYFIAPTMLSMPDHFKRLNDGPLIVSDSGVIFDTAKGRFRHPSKGGNYLHFSDRGKYHNVHRVVAELFVPNPDPERNNCVNHKNFNRWDNHASNLEWCTTKENTDYSRKAGRIKSDGSVRQAERDSGMYKRHGGIKSHHLGVSAMLVHVEGPNWSKR